MYLLPFSLSVHHRARNEFIYLNVAWESEQAEYHHEEGVMTSSRYEVADTSRKNRKKKITPNFEHCIFLLCDPHKF